MTQENHCYENTLTERVNIVLKDEFYIDQTVINIAHAKRASKKAIKLFNQVRLHLSLDFKQLLWYMKIPLKINFNI